MANNSRANMLSSPRLRERRAPLSQFTHEMSNSQNFSYDNIYRYIKINTFFILRAKRVKKRVHFGHFIIKCPLGVE